MKNLLTITLFLCIAVCSAQTRLELTPQGFQSLELKSPDRPLDQLMELSKGWVPTFNKRGYDVSGVTENALTIEARNENAYHYYNVGVRYNCDIVYTLKVVFREDKTYMLNISVKEIYAENVLLKTTTVDFFTADGKLKDDFRDAKPSLENTINKVVKSFVNFINQK
ncbi:hypothetical protein [Flavobacterium sp.]